MYFLYLLLCEDNSIYTGITTDVKRRFKEHKEGTASKYTRAHGAKKILYTEKFKTKGAALKREAKIKKCSRKWKLELMSNH